MEKGRGGRNAGCYRAVAVAAIVLSGYSPSSSKRRAEVCAEVVELIVSRSLGADRRVGVEDRPLQGTEAHAG